MASSSRITAHVHSVRAWRLDDDGTPTGDPVFLPIRSLTLHTPGGPTTMTTQLDPSDPTTLTDKEAGYLSTRPTKALVADLLQELRDERSRTGVMRMAHTDAMMDLRTSEDGRKALQAQLDADPEATLTAELEAAVARYEQRQSAAAENSRQAGGYAYGFAEVRQFGTRQPERPALDSPLGRALLHLAARHSVAIEATVVYPEPEATLAVVPPHLAGAVRNLADQGWPT